MHAVPFPRMEESPNKSLLSVDKTIIIKSSPQAFELFGVKNVPKDLVNGKRPEMEEEDTTTSG